MWQNELNPKHFKTFLNPKWNHLVKNQEGDRQWKRKIPHGIFCLMNSKKKKKKFLKIWGKKAGTRCFRKFQTKPRLKMAFPANSVSQLSFYIFLLPVAFSIHGAAGILLLKLFHLRFSIFLFPCAKHILNGASSL